MVHSVQFLALIQHNAPLAISDQDQLPTMINYQGALGVDLVTTLMWVKTLVKFALLDTSVLEHLLRQDQ